MRANHSPWQRLLAGMLCAAIASTGCAGGGGSAARSVGPGLPSAPAGKAAQSAAAKAQLAGLPKLEIAVPVFDPGLPEKQDEDNPVWPELRRAEAQRFALKLKLALEETGAFGAVRVTPDANATADLYLLGRIEKSTGEEVEFQLEGRAISNARWFDESFEHRVEESFWTDLRQKGKDPYAPVFAEAAAYVVEQLRRQKPAELAELKRLSDLRFAAALSEDSFARHINVSRRGRYSLASYPGENDPMLERARAARLSDKLFVDNLQSHYEGFNARMETSYRVWQEQSFAEAKAKREAEAKALKQKLLGALGVVAGIAAAAAASGGCAPGDRSCRALSSVGTAAGAGVAIAGALGVYRGFQTSEEAEVHGSALEELGRSVDSELAPQVVKFEKETVALTGTAAEQHAQLRARLKEIYELERVPDKQL